MIKSLISLLLLCAVATTAIAQIEAPKRDTVSLSVYNNNQRFMLYPMPFGKNRPDKDLLSEMVIALDTVNVLQASTKKDSTGKYPKIWVAQRQCGKLPTNVKGKVALLYLNKGCDISTQIFNAQQAGALAVVVVHFTNSRDSVLMPAQSASAPYPAAVKITIPCFTVRLGIGARLTEMLPSLVGIKRPTTVFQSLEQQVAQTDSIRADKPNTSRLAGLTEKTETGLVKQDETDIALTSPQLDRIGWTLAPNPVSHEAVLHYNFTQESTLNIEVFNDVGQLVTSYNLPNTQTGKLNIDVSAWQAGTYTVGLMNGGKRDIKRLVVVH